MTILCVNLFEAGSLTGLELTKQTRWAGEPQGSVCLSSQHWGYKHMAPHLTFKHRFRGIKPVYL